MPDGRIRAVVNSNLRTEKELEMIRDFGEMLAARWKTANSLVCVGLDSEFGKIPKSISRGGDRYMASVVVEFNCAIVQATHDLVCAYKPNFAFYAAHGDEGLLALE